MTSTKIARKLERQTKSLEDEVALAQLFSSLLVAGENVRKLNDLQRRNKRTSALTKAKTAKYNSTDDICHSEEYLHDYKHLLPWVPEVFLACNEELSPEISYDFLKLSISYFTPYVRLIFVEKGNLKFWDSKM